MKEQEAVPRIPTAAGPSSNELEKGQSVDPSDALLEPVGTEPPETDGGSVPCDSSSERPGPGAIAFMILLFTSTVALASSALPGSRLTPVAILFLMGAVVAFGQCCIDLWPWKSPARRAHWSAGYRVLALLLIAGGILARGEKLFLP